MKIYNNIDICFSLQNDEVLAKINNLYNSNCFKADRLQDDVTFFILYFNDDFSILDIELSNKNFSFFNLFDFYIHAKIQSHKNFYDMHNFLLNGSIEECYQYFSENMQVLKKMELDPFIKSKITMKYNAPPKSTKIIPTTKSYEFINFIDDPQNEIPQKFFSGYTELLKKKYTNIYEKIFEIFDKHLAKHPIITNKYFILMHQEVIKNIAPNFSKSLLRKFLKNICYYFSEGAFYKCWIPFGVDLRKDSSNYKYQRIAKYKIKAPYDLLFEDSELLKIIEENRSMYISKNYDHLYGFFKPELIILLKNHYQNAHLNTILDEKYNQNEESTSF